MPGGDVEKFLAEKKSLEDKRHELIKDLLRQKEAAIKAFDEKLAKLGYDGEHASKRSHHKDAADKKREYARFVADLRLAAKILARETAAATRDVA